MSLNDKAPVSPTKRRARRLRIGAVIVLVVGPGGAGMIYWRGTRTADVPDKLSMTAYNKPQQWQMEILYVKQGELIENWSNNLKQLGTQAIITTGISALIATGGFYFARLLNLD